jgi:hypothetical protein
MKLEFLKDTTGDGHYSDEVNAQMIRLYDFDSAEAEQFCLSIQKNLIDKKQSLDFNTLDFIESLNCNMLLQLSETNEGINTVDNINFVCELTTENYSHIIKLCEPFSRNKSRGFTWLYHLDNPIDFLFSPHGTW